MRSYFLNVIFKFEFNKVLFRKKTMEKNRRRSIFHYFGPRRGVLPPVLAFLLAGSFLLASDLRLLLVGVDGKTLKKLSKRPCVDVVRVF